MKAGVISMSKWLTIREMREKYFPYIAKNQTLLAQLQQGLIKVPVFRLSDSRKAPWLVREEDVEAYLASREGRAA